MDNLELARTLFLQALEAAQPEQGLLAEEKLRWAHAHPSGRVSIPLNLVTLPIAPGQYTGAARPPALPARLNNLHKSLAWLSHILCASNTLGQPGYLMQAIPLSDWNRQARITDLTGKIQAHSPRSWPTATAC